MLEDNHELDFDLEVATMALKGKRFKEAESKFLDLARKSQSADAWIGLGFAKAGLVLDYVSAEEVFYCFEKAKKAVDKPDDLENTVEQISESIIGEMYKLYASAILNERRAKKDKQWMAFSTIGNAVMTVGRRIESRPMSSMVSAASTALTYNGYIKADATMEQMVQLQASTLGKIEEVKRYTVDFLKGDQVKKGMFEAYLEETVSEVEAITVSEEIKKQVDKQQQIEQKINFLASLPETDALREEAIELHKAVKLKYALLKINKALSLSPDDIELLEVKKKICQGYTMRELLPSILVMFMAISTHNGAFIFGTLVAGSAYTYFMYNKRMKSTEN